MIANDQAMEDLKEQMELKRLYVNCDQVWLHSRVFFHYYLGYKHINGMEKCRHILTSVCMPVEAEEICT